MPVTSTLRRRRRLTLAERRDQIVRVAMVQFARHGFAGTTTQEIARQAGISEALLFRIFHDKRSLYSAIIDRKIAETGDDIFPREAAARQRDEEVFGTIARVIMESMERDPTFTRLMLYSGLEGHELAQMAYEARVTKVYSFLAAYIRRRARRGAFRAVRADLAARTFVGMVYALMLNRIIFGRDIGARFDADRMAREMVDFALRGLRR